MAAVRSFLNRLWTFNRDGKQWIDPDVSVIYPDRFAAARRGPPRKVWGAYRFRRPGALAAAGLSEVFADVFNGNIDAYDPWDGAPHRSRRVYGRQHHQMLGVPHLQGWTALSI